MKSFPVCLIGLEKHLAVVIGGGSVAVRKVRGLLQAGAQVRLIARQVDEELLTLGEAGEIRVHLRGYQAGDLAEAYLVIAATDDAAVNQAVWMEANQRGCLVNVVDDPEHSNFILPAVVSRGELKISISTGGSSPALSRRLREKIEKEIGFEYGILADLLAELRPQLKAQLPSGEQRLQAALEMVDAEILEAIRRGGAEAGREAILAIWQTILLRYQSGAIEA